MSAVKQKGERIAEMFTVDSTANRQEAMNSRLLDQIYHLVGCYNLTHKRRISLVTVPEVPETVSQMADRLKNGETLLCRKGARGQLVGELKRRTIYATSKAQTDGSYLFQPSQPRKFK